MASELDDPRNSATSKSMLGKTMLDGLDRLNVLLPAEEVADDLDDLSARRQRRLSV
jgi:hypothetical protein